MPRSVKYISRAHGRAEAQRERRVHQRPLLGLVHLGRTTDGAEDAGRVIRSQRPRAGPGQSAVGSASGRLSAMNGQAPWLLGSSCTQRTSLTCSNRLR